ncbi:HIT domain-containing protein [Geobacter sp.]|uniref:HIT family protein n=1 Tax=Geobacter sp. TaxID=46610 RepID=UPI00262B8BEA|nr:HIT domain-containing protein [Geobacter sp.]
MERIWAPWRTEYIFTEKPSGCIFCLPQDTSEDREHLVLHRTPLSLVMLNRYPYTNGHLMAAPLRHTADMDSLSDEEMLDLFRTVGLCRAILHEEASPQGFNIGMNLGKAAGAGVDDHLHCHIVPRWNGDTNFMSVVADVRVVPEGLLAAYDRLLPRFEALKR